MLNMFSLILIAEDAWLLHSSKLEGSSRVEPQFQGVNARVCQIIDHMAEGSRTFC